jgi:hypothetical protein
MNNQMGVGLELVYVALENLIILADGQNGGASLAWLLALAADMQGAITEHWQALDVDIVGEIELSGEA